MSRLMFNPEKEITELERYGFSRARNGAWIILRELEEIPMYELYITPTHRYLQIRTYSRGGYDGYVIADSLQHLIYDLTKDGFIVEVEGEIEDDDN